MYSTIYLGRQPIVDLKQQRVAYELLFRSGPENRALFQDDINATAAVIRHTFIDLGLSRVLEGCPGFINVNETLLKSPLIELMPPDNIILEILENVPLDDSVRARCAELRRLGYHFALDDVVAITPDVTRMLPLVDYIKFDLREIPLATLPEVVSRLQGFQGRLLAEKVDSVEEFEACKALGISLFQGYFFARPTVMTHNRATPNRAVTLRLLGLVLQEADIGRLEEVFKAAPDMVLGLLKLVNAAENYRRPVSSIREALMLLGTARLKRWALILLFAADCKPGRSGHSPLLEMAAVRGRMMELLADELGHDSDDAFMAGILSLADSMLAMPMPELVSSLALHPAVEDALLHRNGELGDLLQQVELAECRQSGSPLPQMDAERFNRLQLHALEWVKQLWQDELPH
ncbi:EAL and modified HD-GYP domain-containing signal transduction protein [Vogesella sp. LIG4]|nr:EAL and modified HD-GYP domain-containing signal transduction protein [Vogesella sp. LIG4]